MLQPWILTSRGRQFGSEETGRSRPRTGVYARPQHDGVRNPPRSPFKADLKKTDIAADLVAEVQFAMKAVADTLGVPF